MLYQFYITYSTVHNAHAMWVTTLQYWIVQGITARLKGLWLEDCSNVCCPSMGTFVHIPSTYVKCQVQRLGL